MHKKRQQEGLSFFTKLVLLISSQTNDKGKSTMQHVETTNITTEETIAKQGTYI